MDEDDSEKLVTKLFRVAYGFHVYHTQKSHDHGIDAIGKIDVLGKAASIDVAVQCKCYSEHHASISSMTISQFRGSLPAGFNGIFVATIGYSKDAIKEAEDPTKKRISLIDGDTLVDLLIENQIGCYQIYKIDDKEFSHKKKNIQ